MKKILFFLLLMSLVPAFVLASGQQGSEPADRGLVTLTFWNPFTGDDGPFLQKIIDDFNKEYEGQYKVEAQTLQGNDMYSKLPMVYNSKKGIPDLCVIHIDRIPGFVSKNMLMPMNDMLANVGLTREDFIPSLWEAAEVDGVHYSVALDTHPIFMYYNKKMLNELGFTEADLENLDYDTFIEMAQLATVGDNIGYAFPFGWVGTTFMTLLYQHGGQMVSAEDPGKAYYNSEAGRKALEQIKGIVDAGVTNEPGVDANALFKDGKALFTVDGIWGVHGFNAIEELDWGAMMWPNFGSQPGTWASSHQIVMFNQKKVDAAKVEAAGHFINYLSENSLEWAKAGQVPASVSVLESEDFKSLKWGFTADKLEYFTYPDPIVTFSEIQNPIWSMLTEVAEGRMTVEEGLESAAKESEQKAAELLSR